MSTKIRRKALAVSMAGAMLLSVITPVPFSTPVQAAPAVTAPAQVTADWYKTYQTMDGVGAAYAYTDSIHMMQLATAGHQDKVRHLLDLTFSEEEGTGHDIVRVIIGDNGGLTASGATSASPGFNPLTGLLADVSNPGFDVEGTAIPMRGTAGQYGYKIEAENRYYDGNTDSIWPVEPEHAPGTLVPVQDFVWDYPSWNQPIRNDDGGPTNLLSTPGEDPVVIKHSPRTRKELFDLDQVWTMRQAMQYDVKQFYACTWTVPYWMSQSSTNSPHKIIRGDTTTIDGKPVKIYYQAYADYLVNYIRGMWEQWGIPITHINPFNEVDLAGANAAYVTELINGYIGPTLKKSMQPGGALYDIQNPDGKLIDFIPLLAAVDGTNLSASLSRGGEVFSQTDPDNALDKNPYLDIFTTHLYGTVGIGTDENKLYHTGDFSQSPLDYSKDGSKYPEYLTKYKLWQAEFMNQDTADGSAGAYTQRYGNQNINDAVRWSNLMTNMFSSNPGFNGFVWWSMWDSNGADGSDLIRFVSTNSQQEPGRISTLTGEYRLFKRFYGYGHFSRFMNPGDVRFDVTRVPATDINVVGFKNPNTNDFSITVSNAKNDDSIQPLEFSLKDFPAGTSSVTVFRTSGSENQKKLSTIPVANGKFVIDIPSASIVTIVPSQGTFATYNGLDGERDIFSTLEAEGNDNGMPGDSAGNAGRTNEAVSLDDGEYLAYKNLNFADGSANGGVVRRHLLYLTAQTKSAQGGKLAAYVLPLGTIVSSNADVLSKGTRVAEITVPSNDGYGKFQDMVDTGDLSAYGHKDLYIVAETNGSTGNIIVDRFLFGANDSDWSMAANNSTVSIPGNILLNGDFDTTVSSNTDNWSTGRYNKGNFELSVTESALTADTIQSYSGLSRYLKNTSTSKVAGSGKISGRIEATDQYDGMWQDVTGKLNNGDSYNFKGYFLSMKSRSESYDIAAENPGDVEAALVYYDKDGNQLGITPINGRDMPEPYAAREAGDPAYWSNGKLIGRILEGGPISLSSYQPVDVKVADWHETPNLPFIYNEPVGTDKVVMAVYAKDANILYADQLSLTPQFVASYSIFIDGVQPSNFDATKHDYTYTVSGNAIPKVTAVSNDPAEQISISQANSAQGTAVVRFIKGDTVKTYKISFSTNVVIDFAHGLPAGWEVMSPANPENALSYSAEGATIKTLKGDTEYPNSHNILQFPGSAEGNWTLTAKLTVDKPLNDSSMGENSQVGIGISRISSGEFYRINARKVSTNIKVNNSGKTGNTPFTNNTNQTNLNGTNYYLRIIKEGNIVQGYFSTNSGSTWTAMGSPSTYTQDFFKDAKVQLYGTNTSASTDFSVTFSNVTQIMTLGEAGEVNKDQRSVEEAAALISNRITVPNAAGDDVDTLKSKAQEYLNNHEALKELGVTTSISYQNGVFILIISKGTASVTINPLTIVADVKSTRDFEDQTAQGFKSKGSAGVILTPTQEANHTPGGAYALKITGRTANSDGPTVHLKDAVKVGNEYKAAVWVKLIGPDSAQLKLSALVNTQTPYSITLATQPASSTGDWVKLEGSYRYLNDDVSLVVETVDSATASYYIDDFSFENTNSEPTPSIKDVYKDYFKITNIPGNTAFLNSGTAENAFYNYHFDGVTIGNQLKPDALQKNKGIFTFGTADSMIAKAQSQGQDIHGHVLVWHSQTPAWFNQQVDASGNALKDETGNPIYLSRDEALTNMRTHIKTVMEHYEGIPESWDVVNEAMADAPDPVNDWKEALRKSAWYYSVGPDFIEQAFFAAREVLNNHPEWGDVKLYYNDFNEDFPAKRDAIYDMVKELNDRYASTHPGMLLIDGIGMQSHYDMRTIPANVEASLEKFASLGVKVAISELDVLAGMNSSLSPEMAERQGSLYAQLFQIYKKHADKISNVTIWGPYDTTSWRVTQNPCLFDENLNPKPAYYAVINPEKYLAEHPLYTAPESKSTTALYGTPDIDGTVDDIWEEAPEIQIDNHLMATAETSGTAKTLWDEENLYVLFQVKDTQLSKDNVDKTKQDSVEAYVDEDRINAWPYREDDGEYRVNFAGEQSFKFLSNSTPPTSPGFESAAITAGTDYRVEMKIPFKTITPENGTQIRFDAQINNATGANLVGVATWNDLLGRATKSTEVFGGLTLIGKGDPTPPVWAEGSKLEASDITSTGVTLSWSAATHELGVSSYRIYNGIDEEPITVTGGVYRHQLHNGLMPNTQYTFKVEAGDASGNWSTNGPSVSVTTLPTSDIMPPVWGEESTIEASDITSTGLTLTWSATATDESGISGYKIINGVDDKPITVTNAVYMNTVTGAVYSYQVDGLTSDTHYTFKVEAGDTAGNWSTSGPSVTATTLPVLDTTSPEWPEGSKLESSHVTTERLTLTWTAATDDTAVTVYKIYKGSEQIAVLPGTTFQYDVSGLTSSTRYEFTIQAGDASGNWSTDGPKNLVTTLRSNGGPSVPVPTPTPTVTPTPLPGGTPSPSPTPTPIPTPRPTPPSNFKDVGSKYNWAIKAIDTLYGLDIIKGTSETTFSPEKNITRADFVLLLVRALGLKAETDSNFADVSQGAYYYEAIRIAKKLGIINGVDGNNFNPKGEISRQDMMVMVARALKTVNKLSSSNSAEALNVYEDASKIAFYAKANIATLVKEGIIQGDGKYINPTGTATRAEAAVIIYNIYGK